MSKIVSNKFNNGEIHDWYKLVLGYPDRLVGYIFDQFKLRADQTLIDPFCGTGTTLVEAMRKGINCVGIDANPSSIFAAKVKTNWKIKSQRLIELHHEILDLKNLYRRNIERLKCDSTYIYLHNSGMIERGWISIEPLLKAISIKLAIKDLRTNQLYKNALMLALIAEVVNKSSNVRFGPELYCGPIKNDSDVYSGFSKRITQMANDLDTISPIQYGKVEIIQGDSRECHKLLNSSSLKPFAAVICSPPYPNEHDYTRNSRLELAFLDEVYDRYSLKVIKKNMIRSNTKGIYKDDEDAVLVKDNKLINSIVKTIDKKVRGKRHGFARLYSTVIREYFGGMKRHLVSLRSILSRKARCAYVLGDQSSYLQVHIPTAQILSSIVEEIGFKVIEIKHWRTRWSTTTSKKIDENILVFQKIN